MTAEEILKILRANQTAASAALEDVWVILCDGRIGPAKRYSGCEDVGVYFMPRSDGRFRIEAVLYEKPGVTIIAEQAKMHEARDIAENWLASRGVVVLW